MDREEELRRADEACAADLEPDPFGEWMRAYALAHTDKRTWSMYDLEAAFKAGCNHGWDSAAAHYGGFFR